MFVSNETIFVFGPQSVTNRNRTRVFIAKCKILEVSEHVLVDNFIASLPS